MSAGIFRPIMPNQAVATLLLIENSRSMANVWADLRDHYLQRLVETLETPYPPVPTTMFVLPSLPPSDDHTFCSAVPHQSNGLHDGLRDFRFNYDANNRLTPARISTCIDFLASTKFQGQTAALHLVIVAASSPSEDVSGLDFALPRDGRSVWHLLSEKLTQADILCHIVLAPSHNMRSLTSLFEETIHLQKNVEVAPWFPINPDSYIIRLSSRPGQQAYSHPVSLPYNNAAQPLTQGPISRNHNFPPDSINATTMMHPQDQQPPSHLSKADPSPPPSLVSQLQQAHGLTKKKVYIAKPARQPFFRDERPPAQLPVPLPLPLSPLASADLSPPAATAPPQRDGRAPSHSRVDRLIRLSQGSPTDHYPRLQGRWSRRGSRLSSPEGDTLPSPGSLSSLSEMSSATSYFSSNVSSPISPTATIDEAYQVAPAIHNPSPGLMMPGDGGVIPEPPWLQQQQQQQQHQHAAVLEPNAGFGKSRQARIRSASHNGAVVGDQSFYPTALPVQPVPFNYRAANASTIVTTPPYEPLRTYAPPAEPLLPPLQVTSISAPPTSGPPPLSVSHPVSSSVNKSSSPPQSHSQPTPLPSTPLDLSLDSLPPLSPEDGDRPFFIFEQEPQEAPRNPMTLFKDTSAPHQQSVQEKEVTSRSYPSATNFQPSHQKHSYITPFQPALSPSSFYDQAGYFSAANDYSQQYIRDMAYDVPPYVQPIVTTTSSSLTGWAG